jgi:hypothetical protein
MNKATASTILRATCPACFKLVGARRPMRGDPDALIVAAHGFRTYRNNDGTPCQCHPCPGSREEPFEHSCWGTIDQRALVETRLANYRRELAKIRTLTHPFSGRTGEPPIPYGDPRWDVMQQREIAAYEGRIREATQEAAELTRRIQTWTRQTIAPQKTLADST